VRALEIRFPKLFGYVQYIWQNKQRAEIDTCAERRIAHAEQVEG